jgi:hypothetical protein
VSQLNTHIRGHASVRVDRRCGAAEKIPLRHPALAHLTDRDVRERGNPTTRPQTWDGEMREGMERCENQPATHSVAVGDPESSIKMIHYAPRDSMDR